MKLRKITSEYFTEESKMESQQFLCSVCKFIVAEPYLNLITKKYSCFDCIKDNLSNSETDFVQAPERIKNLLKSLNIHCLNRGKGCPWVGKFGKLEEHFSKDCPKEVISCIYSGNGCDLKLPREEINNHINICEYRTVQCKNNCGCKDLIIYKSQQEHFSICPKEYIDCPQNCGKKIMRKDKDTHFLNECPLTLFPCIYKDFGCQAKILKNEKEKHLRDCFDEHNSMILTHVFKYEEECRKRNEMLESIEKEINMKVMRIKQMMSRFEQSRDSKEKVGVEIEDEGEEEEFIGGKTKRSVSEGDMLINEEPLIIGKEEKRRIEVEKEDEKVVREKFFNELTTNIPDF